VTGGLLKFLKGCSHRPEVRRELFTWAVTPNPVGIEPIKGALDCESHGLNRLGGKQFWRRQCGSASYPWI
jgi:hypothetical protein